MKRCSHTAAGSLIQIGLRRAAARAFASFAALALGIAQAASDDPGSREYLGEHLDAHQHVTEQTQLTLPDVVQEALSRYPDLAEVQARQRQAEAWQQRGRSWISSTPSLALRYTTDRWQADERLTEYEAGVDLPLWSWGARGAARQYGNSVGEAADAAANWLHWQVAGLVRERLWALALAQAQVQTARRRSELAQALLESLQRRHELGDVAYRDVALVRSQTLQAREELLQFEAQLVDSEREYILLTGIRARPELRSETLVESAKVAQHHPELMLAEATVQRQQADLALIRKQAGGSPRLLLGPRRERGALAAQFDSSIGMTLTIPLGGTSHAGTDIADAQQQLAAARAQLGHSRRRVEQRLHEAEHELDVVTQAVQLAAEMTSLGDEQYRLGRRAYDQGEIDLYRLLQIQEGALAAQARLTRLETERSRWIARYNQAAGVLP